MGRVVLSGAGRRRVLRGHPWVYADDVAGGDPEPGELVPVLSPDEATLGWGLASTSSKIAVRMVTRGAGQPDRAFWSARLSAALDHRRRLGLLGPLDACRLVSGDADGLPGLVVDRYADVLVLQSGCQGSDRMRDFLLECLLEELPFEPRAVLDRSDSSVRRLEELERRVEWLRGDPVDSVAVEEEPPGAPRLLYEAALVEGHKTGAYLDQRVNRLRAAALAGGARVLDAFAYEGGFGIRAALAGAQSVLCIEQSAAACERLARNAERNGVGGRVACERGNAMHRLRDLAREGETFDLLVVDPPAFARNRREKPGALRGYAELLARAFALMAPGGVLVAASCSYHVGRDELLGCVAQASRRTGREARLFELAGAAPDHPVSPALPESSYLKCAFLRVT